MVAETRDWHRRVVGAESAKRYRARWIEGFWAQYITGPNVLDIGYRGGTPNAEPIVEGAIGIELDFPGYNGLRLPFPDRSQDAVHASHVLEHVGEPGLFCALRHLREWFRVLKVGGHLILFVPHAYLYERRLTVPPSRWSPEHMRSYTPGDLVNEIEDAFEPNTYRIRHLCDQDTGYRYDLPPTQHPEGCLEIECVVQKIQPPVWEVEP